MAIAVSAVSAGTPGALPKQIYHGTITGESLLRDYNGPAEPSTNQFVRSGEIVARETARAYLNGIKDATEGAAWCYVTGKPHELNEDIAGLLEKLKPDELQGNGAPLVVKALRQLYPCRAVGRKP